MKKIVVVLLLFAVVLSLCGCDSIDYKNAMELFDNGDYSAARDIFVELGDYEDSADMIVECDYQQALTLLEDGDYSAAGDIFVELGDYEDSVEMSVECDYQQALLLMKDGDYSAARDLLIALGDHKDCKTLATAAARYMFVAYLEQQGPFIEEADNDTSGTLVQASDGSIFLAYELKYDGVLYMDIKVGAMIDPEDGSAMVVGQDSVSSYAAYYDAEASCVWDIQTYTKDTNLEWDTFSVDGTTAYGTPYARDTTMLDSLATGTVKQLAAYLEKVLAGSGLGLTMADIGFTAY